MNKHGLCCPTCRDPLTQLGSCARCKKRPKHPFVIQEQKLAPNRGGRPRKYGTQAAKQEAYRSRLETKRQDKERRSLVAELLNIYRRQRVIIVGESEDAKRQREQQKCIERKYHADLLDLSAEQLRVALKVQQETPDTRGRLHNERSGEFPRALGLSEIETLDAVRQHDISLSGGEVQDPQLARGFEVRPEGCGPDSFDTWDESADSADVRQPRKAKSAYVPTAAEKWRDAAIQTIVKSVAETNKQSGPEWDGEKWTQTEPSCPCPFCDAVFLSAGGIENHLLEQYLKEEKQLRQNQNYASDLGAVSASLPVGGKGIETTTPNVPHLNGVDLVARTLRKESRKKPRKKTEVS